MLYLIALSITTLATMFRGFNDVSRWQRCLALAELSRGFKGVHRRPKSDPGLEHINVRIIIMQYVSLYRLYILVRAHGSSKFTHAKIAMKSGAAQGDPAAPSTAAMDSPKQHHFQYSLQPFFFGGKNFCKLWDMGALFSSDTHYRY